MLSVVDLCGVTGVNFEESPANDKRNTVEKVRTCIGTQCRFYRLILFRKLVRNNRGYSQTFFLSLHILCIGHNI